MTLLKVLEQWVLECNRSMERSCNETYKWHKQIERDAYIRVICEIDRPNLIMPLSEQHRAAEQGDIVDA